MVNIVALVTEKRRAGFCPSPSDVNGQITSCTNSCDGTSDHACEKGAKCCFSDGMNSHYCISTVLDNTAAERLES